MKEWFKNILNDANHVYIGLAFTLFGIVSTLICFFFWSDDMVKISNILVKLAVYNLVWFSYKLLFNKRSFKTDAEISVNPIAVTLDCGFYIIGTALCLTLGG